MWIRRVRGAQASSVRFQSTAEVLLIIAEPRVVVAGFAVAFQTTKLVILRANGGICHLAPKRCEIRIVADRARGVGVQPLGPDSVREIIVRRMCGKTPSGPPLMC